MKNILSLAFVCIYLSVGQARSDIAVTGSSHSEYAAADREKSRFFESWNDLILQMGDFRLGGRFSVHRPAAQFGQQADSWGLEHRFIEYQHRGLDIRLGNFYSLFGRGLILRSFENRTLRWDSNIDGVKLAFRHDYFDTQILAGRPRKTRLDQEEKQKDDPPAGGEKLPTLYGGEIKLKPLSKFHFGSSYVYTDKDADKTNGFHRGSIFGETIWESGSLYTEYAEVLYPQGDRGENGRALYLAGDVFIGEINLLIEYKHYKKFALQNGLLTNPPTAIREHSFTLLNRHQLVQNADDERGLLAEVTFPISENGQASLSYSHTMNELDDTVYRDYYGQFELDNFIGADWQWAFGRQEEFSKIYLNFVSSVSFYLTDYYSAKATLEHLYGRDKATEPDRLYYDQMLTIGLSKAQGWTLSFIGEHTTDHTVDEHYIPGQTETRHFYWTGGQLDLRLLHSLDLSLFAGRRRQGKICIGGVCVVKPELEGVEVTLTARF